MKKKIFFIAILLVAAGFFVACNIYTFIPIYHVIAAQYETGESSIVGAGSIFTFFYAAGLLLSGTMSDRFGKKTVMMAGMLAAAFTTAAVGMAEQLASLYIFRALQGLFLGSFAPAAFAYAFELFAIKLRTLILTFINAAFLIAGICGQLISAQLNAIYGWQTVFYVFSGIYFLLFLLFAALLPNALNSGKQASFFETVKRLYRDGDLLKCYFITFTLLFSFIAFYDSAARYFAGSEQMLFLFRTIGLIGTIPAFFTSMLIDRFGLLWTLKTGISLAAVSSLSFAFLLENQLLAFIFSILFTASIAMLIPVIITMIGTLSGNARTKALSIYSFLLMTGAGIASPAVLYISFQQSLLMIFGIFLMHLLVSGSFNVQYFIMKKGKA